MKPGARKKFFYWIYMLSVIVFLLVVFNAILSYQIHRQLGRMLTKTVRWPVGTYIFDPGIGFDFACNVSGPISDSSFYVKTHRLGYRIAEQENPDTYQPGGVLSLGCSLTFGDEINAGQTFTQFIADSLNLPAYNYGVCSFSYIHALLKAQKLKSDGILEKLQPKYVILGCWKGLLSRSRTPIPPYRSKKLPLTVAYLDKHGETLVVRPHTNARSIFELAELYRKEGPGFSFEKYAKIFMAVPRFLYIYLKNHSLYKNMSKYYLEPKVTAYEVYDYYFTGIEKLFPDPQTRIIVLYMPVSTQDKPDEALLKVLAEKPRLVLVDGAQAVQDYGVDKKYYQGRHPQPQAHLAYARAALSVIRSLQDSTQVQSMNASSGK